MVEKLAETREAERTIAEMDLDTFMGFHRELQFAYRYFRECSEAGEVSLIGANSDRVAVASGIAGLDARENMERIQKSPLYGAVRARIRSEMGVRGTKLPSDFTGWTSLEPSDRKAIEGAITTIVKEKMPTGILFDGVSNDSLAAARSTITRYGISGVFVESSDLIATYNKYWDTTVTL